MMVNIYIQTDAKGLKRQSVHAIFTISTMTSKGPADATWTEDLEGTANEVELLALIKAMEHLTTDCDIELYTESQFITSGIDWLTGWREKGWKTAKGKDIAHKDEWMQLDELLSGHEILVHCKEDHSFKKWQQFELERLKK